MPNEFKVKNGLVVDQGGANITGSSNISGSLGILSSGSGVFTVDGTSGRLFSVDDSLSGSLFSVNTVAGLPIMEAFSDNTVRIGQYGQKALFVSQSNVGFGKEASLGAKVDVSGSVLVTGSLSVTSGITGSLFGTSSWASNAVTSSYALTASAVLGTVTSASYAFTASSAVSSSQSVSSSYAFTASSAVSAFTASSAVSSSQAISASYAFTASSAISAFTASSAINATNALTASSADNFTVRNSLTASAALINGTITAQTLVVSVISASVEYSSGSNRFGSQLTDQQTFTGSVNITGSLTVNGSSALLVDQTGSMSVLSSSFATTASYFLEKDPIFVEKSASLATTGSNTFIGNQTITGSINVTASVHYIAGVISASNTIYNAQVQPNLAIDTRGRILYSNFFATTASLPDPSLYHGMFTHVHNQGAAYYSHGSNGWVRLWDHFNDPGLISGSQVPSYITGQAIAPLSVSASSWISASGFFGSGSGLTEVTASYLNPLTQAVLITGSLNITGSTVQTGNNTLIGNTLLSGSITVSGSQVFVGTQTLTGSFLVSGSTTQVGNNTLLGNTVLSGSIVISGSLSPGNLSASVNIFGDTALTGFLRFNPYSTNIDTNISASYIYVSGSTNDLYFAQNGEGYTNTTRLRWLEGNLYTGLLNGALITTQSSTVYQISSGSGIIVSLNASLNNNPYPTVQYVNWPNLSASIAPYSGSYDQQFVAVLSNGTIGAQGEPYSDGDYNTKIPIGIVIHQNRSTINAVQTFPSVGYGWKQRSFDFIKAFGPLKISGYTLAASGSSTGSLVLSGGTAWVDGRNYIVDANNPSYITEAVGIATSKIYRYRQSGSGWAYDTNAGAGYATIDPTQYSNNGVLTPVPVNDWTIQRVFYFPNSTTKAFYIYYGNASYANQSLASAGVATETFSEAPNTAANAIYVGYMLLRHNADFTAPSSYGFYSAGLFRAGGSGGAGGGGGATTLASLSDVSITSPTNAQPLAYNSITAKWENRSTISASLEGNAKTATTASYALTASVLLGSVVSSSYAFTASSAVSSSFAISASYAFTASSAISSSYSYTASSTVSSSYAFTASFAASAFTASSAVSASLAVTASYVANINKKIRTTIPIMATQGQTTLITNIPLVDDEVGTELRVRENLTAASSCSLSARLEEVTAALIGFLKIQYSTDESTWNDLNTNKIDLSVLGTQLTAEEAIPSGAKTTSTYLRLVTSNGDGSSSSNARFGNVTLNIIQDL